MRQAAAVLLTVMALGVALQASAMPVAACSCVVFTEDEARAFVRDHGSAAIVRIDGYTGGGSEANRVLKLERHLAGSPLPDRIVLAQDRQTIDANSEGHDGLNCARYYTGDDGDRWLFVGSKDDSGLWLSTFCVPNTPIGSINSPLFGDNEPFKSGWSWLTDAAVDESVEPTELPRVETTEVAAPDEGAGDVPWVPILALAVVIPLAVLGGTALIRRRS